MNKCETDDEYFSMTRTSLGFRNSWLFFIFSQVGIFILLIRKLLLKNWSFICFASVDVCMGLCLVGLVHDWLSNIGSECEE